MTVTLSDAPLGDKTENVVASTTTTSKAGGVTTLTSLHPHTESHAEQEPGGREGIIPHLSDVLP